MSPGILAVNQTITVLGTKQISMSLSCLCIMIPCRQNLCLWAIFNEKCLIHTKFNRNAEWIPIKILFAWSWSPNIIYSEVTNKILNLFSPVDFFNALLMCQSLNPQQLYLFWQDYTQLDDPGLNHYIFITIMLTKLYNYTWFNFILEFCSFMLHLFWTFF